MNTPALLLKPLAQKTLVNAIQHTVHNQLLESSADCTIQKTIHLSQTAKNTGAHLQQQNREAHEADDKCFRESVDR